MGKFVKGDVVVIPFPFSDLSQSKRRPGLVLAALDGDDVIMCQITSQQVKDRHAIPIQNGDFESGSLKQDSNARPTRIFTADSHIILYKIGTLKAAKLTEVVDKTISIIRG